MANPKKKKDLMEEINKTLKSYRKGTPDQTSEQEEQFHLSKTLKDAETLLYMAKYRIEIDLETCIGAFTCVDVYPELWEQGDDGKAHIIAEGVVKEDGREYVELNDKLIDVETAIQSQNVCPVLAIKITKLK